MNKKTMGVPTACMLITMPFLELDRHRWRDIRRQRRRLLQCFNDNHELVTRFWQES